MAVATTASRATGFLRVLVFAAALGFGGRLLDAYNLANTLPNTVYELIAGGAMASIVVPLLSRATLTEDDGGIAYAQRLLSLLAYLLGAVTLLAILAAEPLVHAFTPGFTPEQRHLAVVFSRFFLPQIVFYGMSAAAGAVLNIRGRFAAPVWAPLINNLIAIAVAAAYLIIGGTNRIQELTPGQTVLLAAGTTAGVLGQMATVLWALARSGFPLRPRLDPRGIGVRRILRFGGWVLLSVGAAQLLFTVATRSATLAGDGAVTIFQYAYMLFQVPYAVIALSLLTAMLPRLSRHAARHDHPRLVADLSRSLRVVSLVIAPFAVAMAVLGTPVARLLFAHARSGHSSVALFGVVIAVFGLALVPFTAYMTLLRGFFALQDTRTPALINTGVCLFGIVGATTATRLLPHHDLLIALPAAYALAYTVGALAAAATLRYRLGRLDGHRLTHTHARILVAGLLAAVATATVAHMTTGWAGTATPGSLVTLASATCAGAGTYAIAAWTLRLTEPHQVVAVLRPMLPGSGRAGEREA
jgi:putative peptidoglycan lipid II flippase